MPTDVVVVVPTFRCGYDTLVPLLASLGRPARDVLVVDDASPCTADVALRDAARMGARVVRHRRNAGIARSLNDGLSFAVQEGASWLLTVDQDSRLPEGYLDELLRTAAQASDVLGAGRVGAVGAGLVDDVSGSISYPVTSVGPVLTTEEVIQTGTLWSVDALSALGGFDERLAMDAVDAAACLALRSAGLSVVLAPGAAVGHQLGAARQVRLLGRDVIVSGHGPERRTSILRNRLRLFPAEFAQSPVHALRTIRRVTTQTTLAVTVEDDRWAKAKASVRGLLPRREG